MAPDVAYQIVHDELMLDGNAPERGHVRQHVDGAPGREADGRVLRQEHDRHDEYPQTAALEARCVNILSRLWHAPDDGEATGCSTTGSSEAAMLGGLRSSGLAAPAQGGR
jgi:glutamate decarboxylase